VRTENADYVHTDEPHRCVVTSGPLGFVASCPCGWSDSVRKTETGARSSYAYLHSMDAGDV
jgi:hypothetical protein